jgi:1,4-alpha-glucan branching enzyme
MVTVRTVGVKVPGSVRNPQFSQSPPSSPPDTTVIQFVFVAPKATSVSLVGDFNGWDVARTPLQPADGSGMWSVTLPLPPGRHRYAFVVDGTRWTLDPAAPRAVEDDFGSPNSVVTVGEHST